MTTFFKSKLLLLLAMLVMVQAMGQGTEYKQEVLLPGSATSTTGTLNFPTAFILPRKVYNASFQVKMDFGPDYTLGEASSAYAFLGTVRFTLQALDASNNPVSGVFSTGNYEIVLKNARPEAAFVKDITGFADASGNFPFTKVKMTIVSTTFTDGVTSPAILSYIQSLLDIKLSYVINYGFSTASATAPVAGALPDSIFATREVQFNWSVAGQEFPNYEFQLLRLFNNSPATATNEKIITAEVDWAKALTIETQSKQTSLKLTVAEGRGYYIWRVRPIGNYFEGGIAHPGNLSNLWSSAPANGTIISMPTNSYPSFFFSEPDDDKNRIYSRIFTEGNKVSETTTYATSLQQVKQIQTYLPSKDTTLVTQTILDRSGRPSLTTMPVPVEEKQTGYISKFVKTKSDSLYKADHFDTDANYRNPARVKQNSTAFQYYSNANTNTSVPDAEGYPYTRTLYYNDGTGRVKEQGGVGKKNMIGTGTASDSIAEGKTVKTMYGTPSEEELIRLFGDEAPDHETVLKTITIDQNNTASVTLKSKEGNVIATSLSFQDNDNDNIFLPLEGETSQTVTNVDDKITKNTSEPYGFVSSKRLALLNATPIEIGYRVKCDSLNLPCYSATTECDYSLQIILHYLDKDSSEVVINQQLKNIACSPVDTLSGLYKTVPSVTRNLTPGNYIIQKILKPGNIDVKVNAATENIDKQVTPITGLITSWLGDVQCERQLDSFFVNLRGLAASINSKNLEDPAEPYWPYNFTNEFKAYFDSNATKYSMAVTPSIGIPQEVTLNSPCCEIKVPVKWVPPFRCVDVPVLVDKNGNGKLDVVPYRQNANPVDPLDPTEFFPDFEGYARAYLGSCYDANTFYTTYMEGWPEGTFNLMVYHMLTDKYKCDNSYSGIKATPIQDSVQAAKGKIYNDCGEEIGEYTANGVTMGCDGSGNCPQYICEDLFNCWSNQLAMLKARLCMNLGIDDQSPYNVSSGFDNENGGDQSAHDDHFDNNMGGGFFLIKWIAKRKVSKRMRDLQAGTSPAIQPEYKQHLVQDFLSCTGYRFAKILTQYNPEPLPSDQGPGITYNVPADGYNVGNTSHWNAAKKSNGDYYYQPFEDWKPGVRSGATNPNTIDSKGFFPNIRNPIYAFKYFEYAFEADSNYQDLEALTCYSDPNDCYLSFDGVNPPVKIPCCVTINTDGSYNLSGCYFDTEYPNLSSMPLDADYTKPTSGVIMQGGVKGKLVVNNFCDGGRMQCLYTKDYWSCGERNAFYLALKSYQIPDPTYYQVFERDCNFMKQPYQWYNNLDAATNGFPDIVSESEKNYLGSSYDFSGPINMLHLDGSNNTSAVSVIDNELAKLKYGCLKKCEDRRSEFETMLRDTLLRKCYVIGGCKTSEDDNIIPEADFQAMVDELVNTCGSLCDVNTYTCLPPQVCRKIKTSKRITGTNLSVNPLYLGSGGGSVGGSADNCPLVSGQGYYDCSADNTTSFCQYTKYLQATTWNMEVEFPSMCPSSEPPKFTCAPGGDTCVDKDSYVSKPGEPTKSVVSGAIQVNVQVNE